MTRVGRRKSTQSGICVVCGRRYKLSPTGGIINFHGSAGAYGGPACGGIRKRPVEGSIQPVHIPENGFYRVPRNAKPS